MLLSICVAVITGRCAWLHSAMMRFWMAGTRCTSISTPRSPRATITASVAATISSRCSTACGFSIFDHDPRRAVPRLELLAQPRDILRRCARTTDPTKSTSPACRAVQSRSCRSLSVSELTVRSEPGRLSPCRERRRPGSVTRRRARPGAVSITVIATVPSANKTVSPGLEVVRQLAVGARQFLRRGRRGSGTSVNSSSRSSPRRRRGTGPAASSARRGPAGWRRGAPFRGSAPGCRKRTVLCSSCVP